jgi:hypothetical protein
MVSDRDEGRGARNEGEASWLNDVVAELRTEVPIRAAWREDVLDELRELAGREAGRARRGKGWTISPPTAIAAALAFTALGAIGAVGVLSLRSDGTSPPPAARRLPPASLAVRSPQQPTRFALVAPGASRVSLVGDFNQWDASATPMRPLGDGRLWLVEVPLPPGRHVYAFVVDGDVTPDPAAPRAGEEDFGVPSSVVLVGARGS